MSLYHEAAEILNAAKDGGGSLKSLVFGRKTWRSDGKTLFALTTETAKWSSILSGILDASGVLKIEKTLHPILALLLSHDLLLSKRGIALPNQHGLHQALSRHKARLTAELTKARIRTQCASVEDLRKHVEGKLAGQTQNGSAGGRRPRWIRINAVRERDFAKALTDGLPGYKAAGSLHELMHAASDQRLYHIDKDIDSLIAITGQDDPTSFKAYKDGIFILQDKASCFPAHLLDHRYDYGDAIDACAAPGNKTTHLAAIFDSSRGSEDCDHRIFACEKDALRAETLVKMVKKAGADKIVSVKKKQDFLRLNPGATEFAKVASILLDPSCSGSGIMGRDEVAIDLHLPMAGSATASKDQSFRGKKRKRGDAETGTDNTIKVAPTSGKTSDSTEVENEEVEDETDKRPGRLAALSGFQLRTIEHAMAFPAATRITYSTCSVHVEENEAVVLKALDSDIAKERGWKILPRRDQVKGMQTWSLRGFTVDQVTPVVTKDIDLTVFDSIELVDIMEGCIRCEKGGEDGTMGFFVAAFTRGQSRTQFLTASNGSRNHESSNGAHIQQENDAEEVEDEWSGFSDEDDD